MPTPARVRACPCADALPLVRGHETGSRDRTRTYNLPVNSRTLCRLSYAGSTRIRVAHLRRTRDAHGLWRPVFIGARPDEYPRVIGEGHGAHDETARKGCPMRY